MKDSLTSLRRAFGEAANVGAREVNYAICL